jgi:hypothetical protein
MFTAGAAAFIVYVLLLTGIFSYFHSEDTVTNKISAKNGHLTILEPLWDQEGQEMAAGCEPGMTVKKNPYAFNDGQVDLYIRMNITVKLDEYTGYLSDYSAGETPPAGWVGAPTDVSRLRAVLNAIYLQDGTRFLNLNAASDTVSEWTAASNNPDYIAAEPAVVYDADAETYTLSFYYIDKKDAAQNMKVVKPEENTVELFRELRLPIYKKDWLGVFDTPYTITVWAEGIPVQPDAVLTQQEAVSEFPPRS